MKTKMILVLAVAVMLMSGCRQYERRVYVLPEGKRYYFIPAGTTFKARIVRDGPVVDVVRTEDTWGVPAGYLAELQKEAGAKALELPVD